MNKNIFGQYLIIKKAIIRTIGVLTHKTFNNKRFNIQGTKILNDTIHAVGGRVLNFVSISDNYLDSRNEAINQIKKLNWKNGFYRSDIGYKVIDK